MVPARTQEASEPVARDLGESITLLPVEVGATGEHGSPERSTFGEYLEARDIRICNHLREVFIREFTRAIDIVTEELRERHRQRDAADAISLMLHERRIRQRQRQRDTAAIALWGRMAASEIFPEVDLAAIARYVVMPDQHAALRAFRDELRAR